VWLHFYDFENGLLYVPAICDSVMLWTNSAKKKGGRKRKVRKAYNIVDSLADSS